MRMSSRDHMGFLSELESQFLNYNEKLSAVRLTTAGATFMTDFVVGVERGFKMPTEVSISTLIVMAVLATGAKGDSLTGIVDDNLFNARIPALEMPEVTEKIRQGLKTELDKQMRGEA